MISVGNVIVFIVLICWVVIALAAVIIEHHTWFYLVILLVHLLWILSTLVEQIRQSRVILGFTWALSVLLFLWCLFAQQGWNPISTSECGTTLCSASAESGQFFNPLTERLSRGFSLDHRSICPRKNCNYASDNGKTPIGYHLDEDGNVDLTRPGGIYASDLPADFLGNLGRGFPGGYLEGFTRISDLAPCPGVNAADNFKGLPLCSHCSYALIPGTRCQSNGIDWICLLCPADNTNITFWIGVFAFWVIVTTAACGLRESLFTVAKIKE